MHETLVKIKDIEFVSYLRPSKLHGQQGVLQMSFRLPHMQEDEMIIDIQKDKENRLYTTQIEYYCTNDDKQFSLSEFDKEELHELLKAVLNSEVTQKELTYYEMNDYVGCYAKPVTFEYEVILTHESLNQKVEKLPMDVYHQFSSKAPALDFFHTLLSSYKEKSIEVNKQNFGAYKLIWEHPQTKSEVLTYILLHHQGKEITSLDEYNDL